MGPSKLLAMSPKVPLSTGTLSSLLSVFQKGIQLHRIFPEFKTKEGCCCSLLEDRGRCGEARPSAGSWAVLKCAYGSSLSLREVGFGLQHSCLLGSSLLFKCLPFGSCLINSFCCWYTHFKILIPQAKVQKIRTLAKHSTQKAR